MALTADQRAAINKQNAQNSTGPTSERGKANSRRNALKHGLRAEALPLPNEDPAVAAARTTAWNDYYQPASPAAQHLVNACVRATLLSDRCDQYQHALISQQIHDAESALDARRRAEVGALKARLRTDHAAADPLKRTAEGCAWMIGCWVRLRAELQGGGNWSDEEREEAARLLGESPARATLKLNPAAWLTAFLDCCNVGEGDATDAEWLAWYLDPKVMPEALAAAFPPGSHPDSASARDSLRTLIDAEIDALRADESQARENEAVERAAATALSLLPADPATAQLFLRYQTESRTTFHRAYSALIKTLDYDASNPTPIESPNEPNPEPAPEPVPPNEANPEPESPNEPNPAEPPSRQDRPAEAPQSPAADGFRNVSRADEAPVIVQSRYRLV